MSQAKFSATSCHPTHYDSKKIQKDVQEKGESLVLNGFDGTMEVIEMKEKDKCVAKDSSLFDFLE